MSKNDYRKLGVHHPGLFIKEARLDQGYTLTEVSEEICCVSHLSKIENGQVHPNPFIYSKLGQKLGIAVPLDSYNWVDMLNEKLLFEPQQRYLLCEIKKNKLKPHEMKLIQLAESVLNSDTENTERLLEKISHIKQHFLETELQLLNALSSIFYIKEKNWQNAQVCINLVNNQPIKSNILEGIMAYYYAHYYFHFENFLLGLMYLKRAKKLFQKRYALEWLVRCDILHSYQSLRFNLLNEVELSLESLTTICKIEKLSMYEKQVNVLWAIYYEKIKHHDLSINYYLKASKKKYTKENEWCLKEIVKFLYHYNFRQQIENLVDGIGKMKVSICITVILEFYAILIRKDDKEHLKKFLICDGLTIINEMCDDEYFNLFIKKLCDLYREEKNYKKVVSTTDKLVDFNQRFKQLASFVID